MKYSPHVSTLSLALALSLGGFAPGQSGPKEPEPGSAPRVEEGSAPKEASEAPRTTIHPSAEDIKPLETGDKVPHPVMVRDKDGEHAMLRDTLKEGATTVLVFYRGGWCPYCTTHLAELAQVAPELENAGVELLALSPDKPEKVAEHLEDRELPYRLLSDSNAQAMAAFGVAFAVDEETVEQLRGYGMDLAEWSGNPENILPVPAVFVVNEEYEITFAHAEPDYTVRLSGEELLKAAGVKPVDEPGSAPREPGSAPREPGSANK